MSRRGGAHVHVLFIVTWQHASMLEASSWRCDVWGGAWKDVRAIALMLYSCVGGVVRATARVWMLCPYVSGAPGDRDACARVRHPVEPHPFQRFLSTVVLTRTNTVKTQTF